MLPILPLIVGGAIGTGVGFALKKFYDENEDEINQTIESGLMSIDEWLDEKLVALDNYKESLYPSEEDSSFGTEENINYENFQYMKKKIYHDSFVNFTNFYEKLNGVDLGKLEYKEIDFSTIVTDDKIYDKTVQHNINITNDLLFKANGILNDVLFNLNELLKEKVDYKEFNPKEKELLKEAFSLAKFIQKICSNDDIAEDVVLKFNNIISNIEEEFKA